MTNPYRKDVRHLDEIDLYVLADLYEVKSHAVFHAIKKLICAGKRGAKDYEQDLMEAIESIERELQILPAPREDDGFCGEDPRALAEFDEQRIDAIGQNGNDGEHYSEWVFWDWPKEPRTKPVGGEVIVSAKYHDGTTAGPCKAVDVSWRHVISYRVEK